MMGTSHAVSGTTAFALALAGARALGQHPNPAVAATGLLATAGAALLPDLDHPDATIAHTFGPVSARAATWVNRVSGGHRHATHSVLFAAGIGPVVWAAVETARALAAIPLLFVLFAFAVRALRLARRETLLLAAALTAIAASALSGDYGWLGLSVTLGAGAHIAGDCLTPEGCPLLWPRRTRYSAPVIRRTGNRVEMWMLRPVLAAATIALLTVPR